MDEKKKFDIKNFVTIMMTTTFCVSVLIALGGQWMDKTIIMPDSLDKMYYLVIGALFGAAGMKANEVLKQIKEVK